LFLTICLPSHLNSRTISSIMVLIFHTIPILLRIINGCLRRI